METAAFVSASSSGPSGPADSPLASSLNDRLAARVPHLLRLARSAGLDDASAEDVVQETLVAAWRKVGQLRSPERFDAWVDQICRRQCAARYRRRAHEARQGIARRDDAASDAPERVAEEFDPMDALEQADRSVLIDRLLAALPARTRALVELCYLAEWPQREAAIALGVSLPALEARLHRARREMRRLLETSFRREAEAFGLHLQADPAVGWRDTREWCRRCGTVRLRGVFEDLPDGRINLRLRCSSCDFQINSGGAVRFVSRHSFRPALRRMYDWASAYLAGVGSRDAGARPCPYCGRARALRVVEPSDPIALRYRWTVITIVIECRPCDLIVNTSPNLVAWRDPAAQAFMADHPHWVSEPESLVTLAGGPALRLPARDRAGSARLSLFAHPRTLEILASAPY
jgi:RNA polymerase sigma factor (sigma-70 family)